AAIMRVLPRFRGPHRPHKPHGWHGRSLTQSRMHSLFQTRGIVLYLYAVRVAWKPASLRCGSFPAMTLMNTSPPKPRPNTLVLTGFCALAACLGACANADREAYFQSRASVVQPQPGNGSARVALWPAGLLGH